MTDVHSVDPITFKNILFITDFSPSSEIALPHAIALAAGYTGKVYIGHVITPQLYDLVPPTLFLKFSSKARHTYKGGWKDWSRKPNLELCLTRFCSSRESFG